MHNIYISIIEDDYEFANELKFNLLEMGFTNYIIYDNATHFLNALTKYQPDIIIMKYNIKGNLNGIELAKKIKAYYIPVIFISANSDTDIYEEAREAGIFMYLVKPFDKITFRSAVESAIFYFTPFTTTAIRSSYVPKKYIFIKNKNNIFEKICFADITYIEADGNYIILHLQGAHKLALKKSLSDFHREMPQNEFIQIHRKYIIKISTITGIALSVLKIHINDTILPIGPSYKTLIKKELLNY